MLINIYHASARGGTKFMLQATFSHNPRVFIYS